MEIIQNRIVSLIITSRNIHVATAQKLHATHITQTCHWSPTNAPTDNNIVVVYSVRTFSRFVCFNSHKQRTDTACYKDFRLLDNFTAVIHAINAINYSLSIVLTATDHRSHRMNVNMTLINAAVFSINICCLIVEIV